MQNVLLWLTFPRLIPVRSIKSRSQPMMWPIVVMKLPRWLAEKALVSELGF